jgi:hypothetical protein
MTYPQGSVTVSGQVFDAETGEFLIGANIIDVNTGKGVSTNNYGFFSLNINSGNSFDIQVSFLGYKVTHLNQYPGKDSIVHIYLVPERILLKDVIIAPSEKLQEKTQMGLSSLSVAQVNQIPALAGESDILKAYQLMPGVSKGHEGSSNFYVRGGGSDQNLILLDDVPLYYVNHLGGFVSVFNTDIIKDSKLIKGGFPARYGNRLSSVLDVRMKDGNSKSLRGRGNIGMVTSKFSLEGPIGNQNTTFIISARRFMWDMLFMLPVSAILNDGDMVVGYSFYDLNAKVKHSFSESDIMFLSFYKGDDQIRENFFEKDEGRSRSTRSWGNLLGTIRWNHLFNPELFSNTTISYTRFRYQTTSENVFYENDRDLEFNNGLYSGIMDLNIKTDFEYFPADFYHCITGAGITWHHFEPGIISYSEFENSEILADTVFNEQKLKSIESFIYMENHLDIGESLALNIGFRVSGYFLETQKYFSFEPRISGRYLLGENLSAKFSFSRMSQNIHLLDYPNFGLQNTDLWIPTTEKISPEESFQYSAGITYSLPRKPYEFNIEFYKKTMKNLIALRQGYGFSTGINWQDNFLQDGIGSSSGIEFIASKKQGLLTGWLSYTYSKSLQHFDELNMGNTFVFKYDRPHAVNLNLAYHLKKNISLSLVWIYQTGLPITFSDGYILSPDFNYFASDTYFSRNFPYTIEVFSEINNFRMKDYHRLDLGVQLKKEKKRGQRTWNFSIYNAYNRQNPYYYYWKSVEEDGVTSQKLYQRCLFPILPSVSYSFEF